MNNLFLVMTLMKDLLENVKSLLKNRGFEITKIEEMEDKNRIMIKAKYIPKDGKSSESALVFVWDPDESIGVQDARQIVNTFNKQNIKRRFIIGGSKFTRMAKLHLEENNVEYIPTELVMLNILEHEYVPKHRILSKEEEEALLQRLQIKKNQLPSIFVSDPVAKIIGAKVGDIIEITRQSKTAGVFIAYRHVVKDTEV